MSPLEGDEGAVDSGSRRITDLMCNVLAGVVVPTPTLPLDDITILTVLFA